MPKHPLSATAGLGLHAGKCLPGMNMVQTKEGAAKDPWLQAQRECAQRYRESISESAKRVPKAQKASPSQAQKTREVKREIAREKACTKARHTAHTKALDADTANTKRAIKTTEAPAKRAHTEKLKAHVAASTKAMADESTAWALKTVQARRRRVHNNPGQDRPQAKS